MDSGHMLDSGIDHHQTLQNSEHRLIRWNPGPWSNPGYAVTKPKHQTKSEELRNRTRYVTGNRHPLAGRDRDWRGATFSATLPPAVSRSRLQQTDPENRPRVPSPYRGGGGPVYMSRKIRNFRTDKFDTWNKRKFWLMQLMKTAGSQPFSWVAWVKISVCFTYRIYPFETFESICSCIRGRWGPSLPPGRHRAGYPVCMS